MAQHPSEPERRSRKKHSHTSSKAPKSRSTTRKPHASPSVPNLYTQGYTPAAQTVPTHFVDPYVQNTLRPPPGHHSYSTSPPRHPVYGQMPQYPAQYGSPPVQIVSPYASQSAVRFTSPPPQKPREEGPFKEHWDRIDRMAARSYADLREGAGKSVTKLTSNYIERPTHAVAMKSMQTLCRGAALCDIISTKFDSVMTSIDDERFSGKEQDLMIYNNQSQESSGSGVPLGEASSRGQAPNDVYPMLGGDKGSNHFSKVWLYSNSRLPPHLPPFKVYMPTYPLLCLAATYSERVYTPPGSKSSESETHIPADWRSGTKAMVLKSVPVEDLNTIVFAIRGSQTFMDWAVNYNSAPNSPENFLDDPSNLCHAGFLYVAKKMVKPVADRLKVLLQENPARSNCSLLITGHSAGGAVAALLYAHMMSTKIESELNYLTSFFKRVHCITFGAPPVTLRPLAKPTDKRHRKSLFYAFINEGDPVPRADKGVVKSLLKLYASPAPAASTLASTITSMSKINLSQPSCSAPPKSKLKISLPHRLTRPSKSSLQTNNTLSSSAATSTNPPPCTLPAWPIPLCSLSPAGRLVVLRQRIGSKRGEEDVEAVTVDDEMLKKVVYGDPLKHQMRVYRRRIEGIAVRAVTARQW
ncbi:alpha/beta-hydrolase [Cucurbitaria berberidis CBS 394.84]|uniref:Alpha/beta-hydrolase n=1 Tax=Cucurbitaria berberidis CBS 394.84 TaxID=1168544 RepID=A0A9P4L9K0_9PLEO|nr:alpha/beta-hydrolase [Cucurbitaria berberidis CBS 394.84]KAF1847296.1 alpha/beta-hydrolase [Cucurbitaria berberidis CBS 394.84]